jgi:hypothetical protein
MGRARVLVSICLAGYAAAALGSGLDRVSRASPALESAVPWPFRAQADRSAASTALLRKDDASALRHARAAVASDPVDIDSAALLASALAVDKQYEAADRAFRVAARFGWRNAATQGYFYDAALQAGDLGVAADRADALLRTHPQLLDEQRLLEPLESTPAGRAILADHLRQRPPWLHDYLSLPADSSRELVDRRYLMAQELAARKMPLGCEFAAPFARSLLKFDRWDDARRFWNGNCPGQKVAGLIGDPTFAAVDATPANAPPFGWQVLRSGDVAISREDANGGGLRMTNSASAARVVLSQAVAFVPGIYKVRVVPGSGQSPSDALVATIDCNGTYPFPERPDGSLMGAGQTLRSDGCAQQRLNLWLNGGGSSVLVRSLDVQKIG